MSCRVVCCSGPDGAQMREVAREVADSLGFSLVDEAIIMHAAAGAGVEPAVVADVEKRRSFIDRALEAFASSSEATSFVFTGGAGGFVEGQAAVSDDLRGLIQTAIEETAARGDVVIVAHAASHALASNRGALRVLVTASQATRCERVAAEQGLSEKDASRALADADANRADYLKRFYGEKIELPTHYDVVVNTDRLSPAEGAAIVTRATGRA